MYQANLLKDPILSVIFKVQSLKKLFTGLVPLPGNQEDQLFFPIPTTAGNQ